MFLSTLLIGSFNIIKYCKQTTSTHDHKKDDLNPFSFISLKKTTSTIVNVIREKKIHFIMIHIHKYNFWMSPDQGSVLFGVLLSTRLGTTAKYSTNGQVLYLGTVLFSCTQYNLYLALWNFRSTEYNLYLGISELWSTEYNLYLGLSDVESTEYNLYLGSSEFRSTEYNLYLGH